MTYVSGWKPEQHRLFPAELKRAVYTMLLANLCRKTGAPCGRGMTVSVSGGAGRTLADIPLYVLYNTLEYMVRPLGAVPCRAEYLGVVHGSICMPTPIVLDC